MVFSEIMEIKHVVKGKIQGLEVYTLYLAESIVKRRQRGIQMAQKFLRDLLTIIYMPSYPNCLEVRCLRGNEKLCVRPRLLLSSFFLSFFFFNVLDTERTINSWNESAALGILCSEIFVLKRKKKQELLAEECVDEGEEVTH